MDVQVSKERIPVVFHDTTVKLCLKDLPSPLILEVPLKDLTIEQMQNAKVAGIKEHEAYLKAKEESGNLDSVEMDFQLFPTLNHVFDEVPEDTGFLIELKYPLAEM
ncbi:glycerophosphocholine phosphodiesterase GPCPD1, partial [Exaiptasia diaphana]|uniref:GP-PDE domain-containing protein n=1 Tax=Exaiptasia diaphana TaxID=2652724 RepID=A0A913Y7G9_EXADI